MEAITFKQFMLTYNFRQYNEECRSERDKYNTSIIRINYVNEKDFYADYNWFEFGMYDFSSGDLKLKQLKEIFSEKILNMYVSGFVYNEDLEVFEINLNNEKTIYEVIE